MLFKGLTQIKIEIESHLHCIDIIAYHRSEIILIPEQCLGSDPGGIVHSPPLLRTKETFYHLETIFFQELKY